MLNSFYLYDISRHSGNKVATQGVLLLRFYELEWASLYRSAHTMYIFGFPLNSVLTLARLAQLVQLTKLTQLVQAQFAKIMLATFSNF